MVSYQDLLSKAQAANFEESLHTLIDHLETRQRQLALALQETTTTLQVLKRLNGAEAGQLSESAVVDELAHLEAIHLPQLTATESSIGSNGDGDSASNDAPSAPTAVAEKPVSTRSKTVSTDSKAEVPSNDDRQLPLGFHPRRSVLKEFQGKILRDAIKIVLKRKQGQHVSIDELMIALYGKNISEKNAEIARTVVIHELSKGKISGHWAGVPQRKGYYWIPA
jgi:hypothetical protein